MRISAARFGMFVVVTVVMTLVPSASTSAQDLAVLRAESLNTVIDGVEAISSAAGQDVSREMIMGMASGVFGRDPSEVLDLDRPVVIVMPLAGMMLQEEGAVAAVPVKDATAAMEAMAAHFASHTVDGELHTFSNDLGSNVYLIETDGYLKLGSNADLVVSTDPLAGKATGSDLALDLFLEPIAPMIEANLDSAKAMIESSLESSESAQQDMPYDPETMSSILDYYLDAVRYILANASKFRLALDVDDGYVKLTKALFAKPESSLAAFVSAQKGGLPKIAKLADSKSAWYMAGQITFDDENKQALKLLVDSYIELMSTMFKQSGTTEADAQSEGSAFWNEYMSAMGQFTDRWVECLRGDMVASFDFPPGEPFTFTEVFGMNEGDSCSQLVAEMGDQLITSIEASDHLSGTITAEKGPKIGDTKSLLFTFDMMKMVEEMGQSIDSQSETAMKAIYGETMTGAVSTAGDLVFAAGGQDATDSLRALVEASKIPGTSPSFAPLEAGPGMMMGINLGEILGVIKNAVPEEAESIQKAADALSGDVGRIPMAVKFDSESAYFEMAVSLQTIETITTIADEMEANAAGDEPQPVYEETGE